MSEEIRQPLDSTESLTPSPAWSSDAEMPTEPITMSEPEVYPQADTYPQSDTQPQPESQAYFAPAPDPIPPTSAYMPTSASASVLTPAQPKVSTTPRVGTAIWGLMVFLVGVFFVALALNYTINITWLVSGSLLVIGVLFFALSLRKPRS